MTEPRPAPRCGRCGTTEDVSEKLRGNECGRCWTYRKLDVPSATYWARVSREFLSNVDMYDITSYLPAAVAGATDNKGEPVDVAWDVLLCGVKAVLQHSERLLKDGPPHTWKTDDVESPASYADKIN